jgi:hypothetical protein
MKKKGGAFYFFYFVTFGEQRRIAKNGLQRHPKLQSQTTPCRTGKKSPITAGLGLPRHQKALTNANSVRVRW